jgi:putative peptidoglycan lipid II flippase
MRSLSRSAVVVTALNCVGLALNLLCGVAIAAAFGAGAWMDVYLAATTLPTFIIGIVANALSFVFIPVFSEYQDRSQDEARVMVNSLITLLLALSIVVCGIAIVFSEWIIAVLTPGLAPDQVVRASFFLRWLLPTVVLTVASELIASLYYSSGSFLLPSLCKTIQPTLTLAFLYALASRIDTFSLVLATLTATALQTAVLASGIVVTGKHRYSPAYFFSHKGVVRVLKLMTPLVLGMLFYRIVPVFDRWLASTMPEGTISVLGYATKLTSILPLIIGSGLSLTVFPVMARYATDRKFSSLQDLMSKSVRILLFISIPISVSLAAFGRPLVQLVLERGAFSADQTQITYYAFSIYLAAVPAVIVGTVIAQGFYVLQDLTTPIFIGIGETIFYIAVCVALVPILGYLSMPITYAIYLNLSVLVTAYFVCNKLRFSLFHEIHVALLQQLVSTIACCAVTFGLNLLLRPSPLLAVALICAGWAVYLVMQRLIFKSEELRALLAVLPHESLRRISLPLSKIRPWI